MVASVSLAVLAAQSSPALLAPPTVEDVVRSLYSTVSFAANTAPDWGKVRGLFLKEAVVVLRTSRTGTSVFSLDGFIEDFVKFAARPAVKAGGFRERVLRAKTTEFGDIAHALVLYDAQVIGSERPPQQGVDSFHLVRKGGAWKIVSIVNEIVTPDRPLPAELRERGP